MATYQRHCRKCKSYQGPILTDGDMDKLPMHKRQDTFCAKCGEKMGWRSNDLLSGIFNVRK